MAGMNRVELGRIPGLCARFGSKYAAIIALGVPTGCRITEILNLRRGDLIDNATGQMREVIAFQKLKARKGAKTRRMAIPDNLKPIIEKHLNEEAGTGLRGPDGSYFSEARNRVESNAMRR